MHIIMFVLDDPDQLDPVLRAWETAGAKGATILESTGLRRRRTGEDRIAARYAFSSTPGLMEEGHYTLFAIVADQATARDCLEVTEDIIGDLDQPHTGVLAAWPVDLVKGVQRDQNQDPN